MNSKMRPGPGRSIMGTASTRTSARSPAGCPPPITSPVSPPSEAPMITGGSPMASITRSTSSAIASTRYRPSAARSLSPCPRKSMAMAVQPSSASVRPASRHECLVWPPPCSSSTAPRDGPSGVQRSPASRPAPPAKSTALFLYPAISGTSSLCRVLAEFDGADQELGDVDDLEGLLGLAGGFLGVDGVAEHDHAVGAGGGDGVGVQGEGLVDALGVDPLAGALFEPHAGAAGAAAEALALAPVHLLGPGAGDGVDDLPRRGVDLVVPAEEARVVVGDLLLHRVDRGQLAVGDEPGQELGVVYHLVVPAELRVLAADGVEAVRAGRDDLLPAAG